MAAATQCVGAGHQRGQARHQAAGARAWPPAARRRPMVNDSGPRFETTTRAGRTPSPALRAAGGLPERPARADRLADRARRRRARQVPGHRHRRRGRRGRRARRGTASAGSATRCRWPTAARARSTCSAARTGTTVVTGPLGDPVRGAVAARRAAPRSIEMAHGVGPRRWPAAPEDNDPIAAVDHRHRRAHRGGGRRRRRGGSSSGVGGSATTDGGLGALRALYPLQRLRGVELLVGLRRAHHVRRRGRRCSRRRRARRAAQVELLRRRLERLAQVYLDEHGVDVTGAAGAGRGRWPGRRAGRVGAQLVPGFDLVADEVDLARPRRGRRPGRHRRGLPRRAVLRGQGRRRRRRAGPPNGVPVARRRR